jgi:hypothetical protein
MLPDDQSAFFSLVGDAPATGRPAFASSADPDDCLSGADAPRPVRIDDVRLTQT